MAEGYAAIVESARCDACGCSWFLVLGAEDGDYAGMGCVRVNGAGVVVGYSGTLVCADCDAVISLPQLSDIPDELGELALESLSSPDAPADLVPPRRKLTGPAKD